MIASTIRTTLTILIFGVRNSNSPRRLPANLSLLEALTNA